MEAVDFKALIKESIREVLREERLMLCQVLAPYVDDNEQADIESEIGSPSDYDTDELVDMTEWIRNGGQIPEASS